MSTWKSFSQSGITESTKAPRIYIFIKRQFEIVSRAQRGSREIFIRVFCEVRLIYCGVLHQRANLSYAQLKKQTSKEKGKKKSLSYS